jgi:hypothetical protein
LDENLALSDGAAPTFRKSVPKRLVVDLHLP